MDVDKIRKEKWESGEPRATSYLLQRLSVAVQRGNAAVILDCINFYFIIINIFLLFIHFSCIELCIVLYCIVLYCL